MINLNVYEILEHKRKQWINIPNKIMYLKDIPSKKYYSFLCRYDQVNNDYDCYILFTNKEVLKDIELHKLVKTTRTTYKIHISKIWDKLPLNSKEEEHRINLVLEESSDGDELYFIDFNP